MKVMKSDPQLPEFGNKAAKPLLLTKYLGLKPIKTRINENELIIADGR
jgi:hypothetical protein